MKCDYSIMYIELVWPPAMANSFPGRLTKCLL